MSNNGVSAPYFHPYVARHETFPPRYGWLKKGYDAVLQDNLIFEGERAIEILGVGANMVRAIRFWVCAFGLVESTLSEWPKRLTGPMKPTPFGEKLLSDDGWDPYLEDPASLWLLHWKLFVSNVRAISWSLLMNLDYYGPFDSKSLNKTLKAKTAEMPELKRYAASSINSDTSCFLRMYTASRSINSEEIECPFTQLALISYDAENEEYQFDRSLKKGLPDLILLSCCLNYSHISSPNSRTISTRKLAYDINSPGQVFKMSENDLAWKLERAANLFDGVSVIDSYGTLQLQFELDPVVLETAVLEHYYS
ncbi:MAG: DUF4007 family protein [Desulfomonilaceae bacterium]